MKRTQLLVILFAVLVLAGAILRIYAYKTGCIMLFMGTLYLCLYYLIKTITDIKNKSNNIFTLLFQLTIALMSVILATKYIYFNLVYLLGLIVVPIFILSAVIYWIKARKKNLGLTVVSVIYFLLCIPMFANFYDHSLDTYSKYFYPHQYMKYNDIGINDSFDFRLFWRYNFNNEPNEEILALALQAHTLAVDEKRYEEAIEVYRQIIAMEDPPDGYMYYQLSDCYIRTDQNDLALLALDSAIILEPWKAEYYSTRGWMHLNLKNKELAYRDLEKSLQLDSTAPDTYLNLSLVYYYLDNDAQKAYEAFKKAEFYNAEFAGEFSSFLQEVEKKLAQE